MKSTNTTVTGCGFHHLALKVRNFEKSHRFYTVGLGFHESFAWGEGDNRAAMLDFGDGNYLEIYAGGLKEKTEDAMLHFALRTSDCDGAVKAAQELGAEITVTPKDVDIPSSPVQRVRIAFLKGPDGEIVEFFQQR